MSYMFVLQQANVYRGRQQKTLTDLYKKIEQLDLFFGRKIFLCLDGKKIVVHVSGNRIQIWPCVFIIHLNLSKCFFISPTPRVSKLFMRLHHLQCFPFVNDVSALTGFPLALASY